MARPGRATVLALQRERLCARSAALRGDIARDLQGLAAPLALGDQARGAWQWMKANPQWPLAAAAVTVVVLRPRRTLWLATRVFGAWQLWRRVRRMLA